jgi:hypothetical protein
MTNAAAAVARYGSTSNDLIPVGPSYFVMATGNINGTHQDALIGSSAGTDPYGSGRRHHQ